MINRIRAASAGGRFVLTLAGVVFSAVLAIAPCAPAARAAKPPSFALWTARWKNTSDQAIAVAAEPCQKKYGNSSGDAADRAAGECFVSSLLPLYAKLGKQWELAVARIATGQKRACRSAIHSYWLASTKDQKAFVIYLEGHRHTPITRINEDSHDDPLATLKALTDEAKSHAIRVCG